MWKTVSTFTHSRASVPGILYVHMQEYTYILLAHVQHVQC